MHLRENLQRCFLHEKMSEVTQTTLPAMERSQFIRPPFVSPNSSSTNLHEHEQLVLQQQQQQHQQQQQPLVQMNSNSAPARPLKKRMVARGVSVAVAMPASAAADALQEEQEEAVLRRKVLAAKLRAHGISRRLVIKPSAFARTIFVKNTTNSSTTPRGSSPIIEIPPFYDPTPVDMEIHQKYSQELYNYVRKGTDLEGFKQFVRQVHREYSNSSSSSSSSNGQHFRCSNRFGESLLHLACRRGRTDMVRFLVEEFTDDNNDSDNDNDSDNYSDYDYDNSEAARQALTIRDDCFKTPLHDACWTPSPNFELVELILKHCPEQVLMEDVRGNTPFDYVRKEDYKLWLGFLWQRRALLRGVSSKTRSSASIRETGTLSTSTSTSTSLAIPSN